MSLNVSPIFDAASSSGYSPALSTYNWQHVIGRSLPNRCLVVAVSIFAAGSVSTITLGAQNLTFVRGDTSGVYRTEIWQLVNPTEGEGTITVTLSASLTSIANAASYCCVDPTSPIEANSTAAGTGATATGSVTTVKRLARVVAALTTQAAAGVTSNGAQSSRAINAGALGTGALDDKGPVDPVGSTSLTWTGLGAADVWVISFISLKPAPTPNINADWYKSRPRGFAPGLAR